MKYSIRQEDLKDFLNHGGLNMPLAEYPGSIGMAQRYVQVVKNMLTKTKDSGQDLYLVMLGARNIPVEG